MLNNPGYVFWITGLSGSGKSTLGNELCKKIRETGLTIVFLDGDLLREMLANKYSYTAKDRLEATKVYSNLCKHLAEQGVHVAIACIGLFHEVQAWNRENIKNYVEVFMKVPLEGLVGRNNKGVYDEGTRNVLGLGIEPEYPKQPDITIENIFNGTDEHVKIILKFINQEQEIKLC